MNVAGQWTYTKVLTEVVGGGCVGEALLTAIGSRETGTLEVTQYDDGLLAATTTPDTGEPTCFHTGSIANDSMIFSSYSEIRCTPAIVPFQCSTGEARDVHLLTRVIAGTVTRNARAFEASSGDNVDVWLAGTRFSAGNIRTRSSFSAVRR
jgi:hypothetical protein